MLRQRITLKTYLELVYPMGDGPCINTLKNRINKGVIQGVREEGSYYVYLDQTDNSKSGQIANAVLAAVGG